MRDSMIGMFPELIPLEGRPSSATALRQKAEPSNCSCQFVRTGVSVRSSPVGVSIFGN